MLRKSIQTFLKAPFWFAIVQLPETITDYAEKILPSDDGRRMLLALTVVVPLFCIASTLSNACTFLLLEQQQNTGKISLKHLLSQVGGRITVLIPVALLVGFLVAIGMVVIFPAVYFMAVYLFVPILLFTEPKSAWTAYLHRSKNLAKISLIKTFLIAFIILLVGVGFEFGFNHLESSNDSLFIPLIKTVVVTIFSALASLCVCYYFKELKGRHEEHGLAS